MRPVSYYMIATAAWFGAYGMQSVVFAWLVAIVLIVAGIAVLVMGNERLQALIDWFASRGPAVLRVGGAFALLFGLFLVYALI